MSGIIDAHQHFWHYFRDDFPWMEPGSRLAQDWLPAHLRREMDERNVTHCIAVQARQSVAETEWLLDLTNGHRWILGVVGWCDLRTPDLAGQLDRWRGQSRLVGFRHIVQDEADPAFLLREDVLRGVRLILSRGYAYDILVREAQRVHVDAFLRRAGPGHFIIDHGAKPEIRQGKMEPWAMQMRALATHPTLWCKISGLPTEADHRDWTEDQIMPYLEQLLEIFGPDRLIFGSDWPVCMLAASYARAFDLVQSFVENRCPDRRADIFGGNARRAYRLDAMQDR